MTYISSPGPPKHNANNVLYLATIYFCIHELAHSTGPFELVHFNQQKFFQSFKGLYMWSKYVLNNTGFHYLGVGSKLLSFCLAINHFRFAIIVKPYMN